MRSVVQRVSRARVVVEGEEVGAIDTGLLALVGLVQGDTDEDAEWLARKLIALRVFPDEAGKMNKSVLDVNGGLLVVSQFTLAADVDKGTRPSFASAMAPEEARRRFDAFVARLKTEVPRVETGRFAAMMDVQLHNDGPVTLWLDSRKSG